MASAREALEKKRKVDDERQQVHDAFMSRDKSRLQCVGIGELACSHVAGAMDKGHG